MLASENSIPCAEARELRSRIEKLERQLQKLLDSHNQVIGVLNQLIFENDETRWEIESNF